MDVDVDLGQAPIGSGRIAEVFAIDERRVVKLLRPEWPMHFLDREAAAARAAHAAGVRTPDVLGTTVVDGRPGIVFERIAARSMIEAAIDDLDRALELADRLGDLQAATLRTTTPGLENVKQLLHRHIRQAELPATVQATAAAVLDALPDGDNTLHFDLHPGNVLVGDDGLTLIDWSNGSSGHLAADLARTRLLMTPSAAGAVIDLDDEATQFVIEFAARHESRCHRQLDVSEADIDAWRLPVVAARVHEVSGDERAALQAEATRLGRVHTP